MAYCVPRGGIFYGETRGRMEVEFTREVRASVRAYAEAMHRMFEKADIPVAEERPRCQRCSLKDICMPKRARRSSASDYLKGNLYEEIA